MTDAEIIELLVNDCRKARAAGWGIDMDGWGVKPVSGVWLIEPSCTVCAMGAHLLGKPVENTDVVNAFAWSVVRTYEWATGFNSGSLRDYTQQFIDFAGWPGQQRLGYEVGRAVRERLVAEGLTDA